MKTGRIGLMLAAAVALGMATTAEAGSPGGAFGGYGPVVRDHRMPPVVRDHRVPTPPPVVRGHRTPPVVRDHRTSYGR